LKPDQAENSVLNAVRLSLGRRPGDPVAARPPAPPFRKAGNLESEIALFLKEVNALSGSAKRVNEEALESSLQILVRDESVKNAVLGRTDDLAGLKLEEKLKALGVEITQPAAGKHALARCDLGITGADFALPETGTLGLLPSPDCPRAVSLLPRVHLAVVRPSSFRPDLDGVFLEAINSRYLVFITGPSRTADIELTVTLGVHGPKSLHVWVVEPDKKG
jgi:L-lactate dehydrogenase complex protein LldG